jgi:hypothetical protein
VGIRFEEINGEIFVVNSAYEGPEEEWLVDAGFACGWIKTRGIRIVDTAPIFKKWRGWEKPLCPKHWRWEKLGDETEESLALLARGARTLTR